VRTSDGSGERRGAALAGEPHRRSAFWPAALILALLLTVLLFAAFPHSPTMQVTMQRAFCPEGWTLERAPSDEAAVETTVGTVSVTDDGWIPNCRGPQLAKSRCTACIIAMSSPVMAVAICLIGATIWSKPGKPSTLVLLRQLEMLKGLGGLTPEQYEEMRRRILSSPDMSLAEWETLLREMLAQERTRQG